MHNPKRKRSWKEALFGTRRLWLFWLALMAMFVGSFVLQETVLAISYPDTDPTIEDVQAFSGVINSGDMLVVVEYTIPYATLPDEIVSDAYVGRFKVEGVEVKAREPYAFNDKGYNRGVFSFYWTALELADDSIEFGSTTESYTVTLQGKIGVFTGSVPSVTTPSLTEWQSNGKKQLYTHIKDMAYRFENDSDWTDYSNLLESNTGVPVLSTEGEEYFSFAIPNLREMIPDLFSAGTYSPDIPESPRNSSYEAEVNATWDGNWIGTLFNTTSINWSIGVSVVKTLFGLLFMGGIAFGITSIAKDEPWGLFYGMMTVPITFSMSMWVNLFNLQVGLAIAFLCCIVVGWTFLGRRGANA